ncbi:MAG: hypothetical protein VKK80_07320 [Prochlorothrix sp.]|nr:hypothetical protein [Prochlorothrix sp.]
MGRLTAPIAPIGLPDRSPPSTLRSAQGDRSKLPQKSPLPGYAQKLF